MRVFPLCVLLTFLVGTISLAQDTNFSSGPQYLMTGSPTFARPISTPSFSFSVPPADFGPGSQAEGTSSESIFSTAPAQTFPPPDLFPIYYGGSPSSIVETNPAEPPEESSLTVLPPDFIDTGVARLTTVQSLRERGYGITVGGLALFEKTHARRATRLYTNADVDRLSGGK